MFCKCYFASLWEEVNAALDKDIGVELKPRVQLQPVYLPTVSYMAESPDGYTASIHARFEQAKRHSYGVVELGYCLLQYAQLLMVVGASGLPLTTHLQIFALASKMITVHIINTVQAFSLVASILMVIPSVVHWVVSGGLLTFVTGGYSASFDLVHWAMAAAFGP